MTGRKTNKGGKEGRRKGQEEGREEGTEGGKEKPDKGILNASCEQALFVPNLKGNQRISPLSLKQLLEIAQVSLCQLFTETLCNSGC